MNMMIHIDNTWTQKRIASYKWRDQISVLLSFCEALISVLIAKMQPQEKHYKNIIIHVRWHCYSESKYWYWVVPSKRKLLLGLVWDGARHSRKKFLEKNTSCKLLWLIEINQRWTKMIYSKMQFLVPWGPFVLYLSVSWKRLRVLLHKSLDVSWNQIIVAHTLDQIRPPWSRFGSRIRKRINFADLSWQTWSILLVIYLYFFESISTTLKIFRLNKSLEIRSVSVSKPKSQYWSQLKLGLGTQCLSRLYQYHLQCLNLTIKITSLIVFIFQFRCGLFFSSPSCKLWIRPVHLICSRYTLLCFKLLVFYFIWQVYRFGLPEKLGTGQEGPDFLQWNGWEGGVGAMPKQVDQESV